MHENFIVNFPWKKMFVGEIVDWLLLLFQEDPNEYDDGGNIVTSQPGAGQATSNMPVFAMPPPQPSATNPFANETSNLNSQQNPQYTPGKY